MYCFMDISTMGGIIKMVTLNMYMIINYMIPFAPQAVNAFGKVSLVLLDSHLL